MIGLELPDVQKPNSEQLLRQVGGVQSLTSALQQGGSNPTFSLDATESGKLHSVAGKSGVLVRITRRPLPNDADNATFSAR